MKAMRIFWSAGTAIGLVVAAPAFAAEETAPDSVAAEGDIIVTAQRRAESMPDIGMASQAVDAETLEQLRVTAIHDLTPVPPTFTVSPRSQAVPPLTLPGNRFNTINLSPTRPAVLSVH